LISSFLKCSLSSENIKDNADRPKAWYTVMWKMKVDMLLGNFQLLVMGLDFCMLVVLISKNQNYESNELFEMNIKIHKM